MDYKTVELTLVKSSNPTRSKSLSQERLLNLYPEPTPSGGYSAALFPWPGSKEFSDGLGLGTARGCYTTSKGVLYKVVDTSLYSINSDGVESLIGSIPGSDYVIMDDDGANLLLATGSAGYTYDGATLAAITDPDYEAGGSVTVLNKQAIWQGLDQRFAVATAGAPTDISQDFYATAESSGDSLNRVFRFKETLYLMGDISVEPWYNSGSGTPPFDSIQNSEIPVGIISRESVSANENYMYWIGNNKDLYRASAYTPKPIMTPAIHGQFSDYDMTGCRLKCLKRDGQQYVLILTDSASWMYSETSNSWIELEYSVNGNLYLAYDYTYAYGKHLIQSRLDGRMIELDDSLYKDVNEPIAREFITAPVNGSVLGLSGSRFTMKRAEIIMEPGVGNLLEENPLVMVSVSTDYGQSFTNEQWIQAGRAGDNSIRVEYYHMASFKNLQFKVRTTDPNFFTFQAISLDIKKAGGF